MPEFCVGRLDGNCQRDVILSGGGAGAREPTAAFGLDAVDGVAIGACGVGDPVDASLLRNVLRSLGARSALLRMTSRSAVGPAASLL